MKALSNLLEYINENKHDKFNVIFERSLDLNVMGTDKISPYYHLYTAFIEIIRNDHRDLSSSVNFCRNTLEYNLVCLSKTPKLLSELKLLLEKYDLSYKWNLDYLIEKSKSSNLNVGILSETERLKWMIEKSNICKWLDLVLEKSLPSSIMIFGDHWFVDNYHYLAYIYSIQKDNFNTINGVQGS